MFNIERIKNPPVLFAWFVIVITIVPHHFSIGIKSKDPYTKYNRV